MSFLICDLAQDFARMSLLPNRTAPTNSEPWITETLKSQNLAQDLGALFHKILSLGNIKSQDLKTIGFINGPGPFTAIRTLLNLIQTLSFLYPHITFYSCSHFLPLALHSLTVLSTDPTQKQLWQSLLTNIRTSEIDTAKDNGSAKTTQLLLAISLKSLQEKSFVQYFQLHPRAGHTTSQTNSPMPAPPQFPVLMPKPLGPPAEINNKTIHHLPTSLLTTGTQQNSYATTPIELIIGSNHASLPESPAAYPQESRKTSSSPSSSLYSTLTTVIEQDPLPAQMFITLFTQEHQTGIFNLKTTYPNLKPLYLRRGYT